MFHFRVASRMLKYTLPLMICKQTIYHAGKQIISSVYRLEAVADWLRIFHRPWWAPGGVP